MRPLRSVVTAVLTSLLMQVAHVPFVSASSASSEILLQIANRYGSLSRRYSRDPKIFARIKQSGLTISDRSVEQAGHVGQALVMMWILGATEILKKEVELARVQGRPLDKAETFKKSGEVAEVILNSGSIWSGFLGAGVSSAALSQPLNILKRLSEQTATRKILKSLIQSGAMTFGTFVGWETASELFSEAADMLESDADRERSKQLFTLLTNSIVHVADRSSITSANDTRILKLIVRNMFKIVLFDSELRSSWLYNTWRNRIATGQFVTMVAAMASSSAIGTLIFPGAGTLTGLMFGVAGGMIALAVPERIQDRVTDFIQDARSAFWKLGNGKSLFYDHIGSVTDLLLKCIPQHLLCPPLIRYDFKPYAGEQTITIAADRIRRYDLKLQELIGLRSAAQKSGQIGLIADFESQIQEIEIRYRSVLGDLKQVYSLEYRQLQKAIVSFDSVHSLTNAEFLRYPQLPALYHRCLQVRDINAALTAVSEAGEAALEQPTEDYLRIVYKFSFYGFQEVEFRSAI